MAKQKGKKAKQGAQSQRAASSPSTSYTVRWHPDAEGERNKSEPAAERVAMNHAVEKLEVTGPRLPYPHSSAVQGKEGEGFRELRPRAGRSRWRPIYRQVTSTVFVVFAVAPESEIDGRGYTRAVKRAAARYVDLEV